MYISIHVHEYLYMSILGYYYIMYISFEVYNIAINDLN